jgi:hypothetical protein
MKPVVIVQLTKPNPKGEFKMPAVRVIFPRGVGPRNPIFVYSYVQLKATLEKYNNEEEV